MRTIKFIAAVSLWLACSAMGEAQSSDAAKIETFEKSVRPILVNHCYGCHSADTKPAGDLRVDDRNGLLRGGKTGPAVVPGDPAKSLLLKRVTQKDEKRRMPLEGEHLSESQVAVLTNWIRDGAAWPEVRVPASLGRPKPQYEKLKREHWAWQPLAQTKASELRNSSWAHDDIDRFVLAKLKEKGLVPSADATKLALIRRVTFDLTGLPPSPTEIDAFLAEESPKAFESLVDRLLASPRFGERWGRHWLDVARYGESSGPSRNIPYPFAWKYRDYVIDSINADIPFDRFVREQIAGDLIASNASSNSERDRLLTATGFLAVGVKDVNQRFKERFVMDNVDEQIDVVTRGVLGLTASCARCHDHKFDPIPTTDYYALAGIFASTDNCAGVRNKMGGGGLDYYDPSMLVKLTSDLPEPPAEEVERLKAEVAAAKKEWDAIRGTPAGLKVAANGFPTQRPFRLKYEKLQGELLALTDPAARGHAVHGVRDANVVADTQVRIRGEAEKLGPTVPRGFLTALTVSGAASVNPKQSGRLELANWLTSENNALTQRVIVNRIWSHLFGRGIVGTADNFGITGDAPTHPELLDHLAKRFAAEGWSLKKLIRTIVLSRTYHLSSDTSVAATAIDPGNRLIWRHTPRRLDAEEIRDAMLVASGQLNIARPAGSPAQQLKMIEMRDNGPEASQIHDAADRSRSRSIYLPLLRGVTPRSIEVFDPVDQSLVTGTRETTTVPTQSLYLLNSGFVRRASLMLAEKLLANEKIDDVERVRSAYKQTLGRTPTQREIDRALAFVGEFESSYRANPPTPPAKPKGKVGPKVESTVPANPDEIDQTGEVATDEVVWPKTPRAAAWLALTQAIFGSGEFRYLP